MPVTVTSYVSPTLVLLAFDWPEGAATNDFLGFAIKRTPGFDGTPYSWLPNRLGFDGPAQDGKDLDSNLAPVQKFSWWDARINTADRGKTISYEVSVATGSPESPALSQTKPIDVTVPNIEEQGIATYFNRAVVSSQAFSRQFPQLTTASQQKAARAWLANGLEHAIPLFMDKAGGKDVEGAIYHLTDNTWIIPALKQYGGALSLAYNHTTKDSTSDQAITDLVDAGRPADAFAPRTKASIMHDKFLVRVGAGDSAEAVLMGSTNFTPEALSVQANLLHMFESPELAALYLARKRLLDGDPTIAHTASANTGWSNPITVGDATVEAFFPPEPTANRESIDAIVGAINSAKSSVIVCAFDPTDKPLLDAAFAAGDNGKLLRMLINRVPSNDPAGDPARSDVAAAIAIKQHAELNDNVVGFGAFKKGDVPAGFEPEKVLWPHENPKIMVRIHHKFVVIDGESDNPIIFTGSANFSNNSMHHNDENLLRITNCPRLARIYVAEFMRLFEHYRARKLVSDGTQFRLARDNSWAARFFDSASPDGLARIVLAQVN